MNCRSAEDLFSSFLEEETSQKERRSLEAHLAECRRCSAAVEELRATVQLMSALPSYETGPHFEEDVMERIRSGEALRPNVVEWLSEWLQPARLRPAFLAGATACAVWIAFLIANPTPSTMVASRTPSPANTSAARSVDPGSVDAAAQPPAAIPGLPAGSETIAAGPRVKRTPSGAGSEAVASTARSAPDQDAAADSARGNGPMYQDEYILDQFYLNRSSENGVHSIVPVTGRASDDVYITF